jgi:hypothetical protein
MPWSPTGYPAPGAANPKIPKWQKGLNDTHVDIEYEKLHTIC